jgi:hypothetical protein
MCPATLRRFTYLTFKLSGNKIFFCFSFHFNSKGQTNKITLIESFFLFLWRSVRHGSASQRRHALAVGKAPLSAHLSKRWHRQPYSESDPTLNITQMSQQMRRTYNDLIGVHDHMLME